MEREEELEKQVRKLTHDVIQIQSILKHIHPTMDILVTDFEERKQLDHRLEVRYHG